jgi:splicing factor 45
VQVEKKKKKEGESGSALGARGKIIGGKRKEGADQGGKFGPMSSVIVLRGMVDGMDLDEEVEGSGGLMQEIGEECGEKVS